MATIIWLEGFESQITGTTGISGFNKVWDSGASTSSSFTTGRSAGGTAWRALLYGATNRAAAMDKTYSPTTTALVGSFFFRWIRGNGEEAYVFQIPGLYAGWTIATNGRLKSYLNGVSNSSSTTQIDDGNWHLVDFRADVHQNPWTLEWKLDGVDQTTRSEAVGAYSIGGIRVGEDGNSFTTTCPEFELDDIVLSTTSSDYPLGKYQVILAKPTSTQDITNIGGSGIAKSTGGTTNLYDVIDEVPPTVTDYLLQANIDTGYVQWAFDQVDSGLSVAAARGIVVVGAASGNTDNGSTRFNDGTSDVVTIAGGYNANSGGPNYNAEMLFGTAKTGTAFNAYRGRFGYSTDANPDPYLYACFIEYAVVDTAGPPVNKTLDVVPVLSTIYPPPSGMTVTVSGSTSVTTPDASDPTKLRRAAVINAPGTASPMVITAQRPAAVTLSVVAAKSSVKKLSSPSPADYIAAVKQDNPLYLLPFDETSWADPWQAADSTGHGNTATYNPTGAFGYSLPYHPELGVNGPIPAHTATYVYGVTNAEYGTYPAEGISIPYNASYTTVGGGTNPWSMEIWFKGANGVTNFGNGALWRTNQYNGYDGCEMFLGFVPTASNVSDPGNPTNKPAIGFATPGTSSPYVPAHFYFIASPDSVADGNWHHIVGTWDGTTLAIYVDGTLKNSTAPGVAPSTTVYSQNQIIVGGFSSFLGYTKINLDGSVAMAALYGSALTSGQISDHYAYGTTLGFNNPTPTTVPARATVNAPGTASPMTITTQTSANVAPSTVAKATPATTINGVTVSAVLNANVQPGVVQKATPATTVYSPVVGSQTNVSRAVMPVLTTINNVGPSSSLNLNLSTVTARSAVDYPSIATAGNVNRQLSTISVLSTIWAPAQAVQTNKTLTTVGVLTTTYSLAIGVPFQNIVTQDGPAGYWRLDDRGGGTTAADSSGHGHNGTYGTATVDSASGVVSGNHSIQVSQTGLSYMTVADHADFHASTAISIEAWVARDPNTTNGDQRIFQKGTSDWIVLFLRDQELRWQLVGSFGTKVVRYTPSVPPGVDFWGDGKFHHIVATWSSGSTLKLYVDGSAVTVGGDTASYTGTLTSNTLDIYWAAKTSGGSNSDHLPGWIDEAAIYTTELSSTRVAAHYGGQAQTAGALQVTQEVVEGVITDTTPTIFATQESVETVVVDTTPGVFVTQIVIEAVVERDYAFWGVPLADDSELDV